MRDLWFLVFHALGGEFNVEANGYRVLKNGDMYRCTTGSEYENEPMDDPQSTYSRVRLVSFPHEESDRMRADLRARANAVLASIPGASVAHEHYVPHVNLVHQFSLVLDVALDPPMAWTPPDVQLSVDAALAPAGLAAQETQPRLVD